MRKKVVQQMSTVARAIPGSVGERKDMRQKLESMVDQLETESADAGEHGGRGRLPAGFCTFTCAIYKWQQLFELIMRSLSVSERAEYLQWQSLGPGPEQEEARRSAFYRAALRNPGPVSWYCALRLEMTVKLAMALLGRALHGEHVPGKAEAAQRLQTELARALGGSAQRISVEPAELPEEWGRVDDFWATFEWSAGGMVHVHVAYWIVGSPRIDKVVFPGRSEDDTREVLWMDDDGVAMEDNAAAAAMAAFYDRAYTEWNLLKPSSPSEQTAAARGSRASLGRTGEKSVRSPESLSFSALEVLLQGGLRERDGDRGLSHSEQPFQTQGCVRSSLSQGGSVASNPPEKQPDRMDGTKGLESTSPDSADAVPLQELAAWGELADIIRVGKLKDSWPIEDASLQGPEHRAARASVARRAFIATLAEWVQMHDNHLPFPMGPPDKSQACAKVENEFSIMERCFCGKLFPRNLIEPGLEEVSEDPRRRELYRLWVARNCHFINNYIPVVLLATLSNMDFQPTTTKFGVVEYMTKYMTKSGQGPLLAVMENSFAMCVRKATEDDKGAGAAIQRFFFLLLPLRTPSRSSRRCICSSACLVSCAPELLTGSLSEPRAGRSSELRSCLRVLQGLVPLHTPVQLRRTSGAMSSHSRHT